MINIKLPGQSRRLVHGVVIDGARFRDFVYQNADTIDDFSKRTGVHLRTITRHTRPGPHCMYQSKIEVIAARLGKKWFEVRAITAWVPNVPAPKLVQAPSVYKHTRVGRRMEKLNSAGAA